LLAGYGPTGALGQSAAEKGVPTNFAILVGFPSGDPGAAGGTLLVPGTVIPLSEADESSPDSLTRAVLEKSLSFTKAAEKLWSTFRLDPARRVQKGMYRSAEVGVPLDLPSLNGTGVSITATLISFNDASANFRIVFKQGESAIADSTVRVNRGGRAVVGGMNGEAAPYIFVFIEPESTGSGPDIVKYRKGMGITEPTVLHRVMPHYPAEARKDKVRGVVVLEAVIDTEGRVRDIRVLEDPDPRLSEAAIAALRQWIFQPARTEEGKPIMVRTAVTIRFELR